MTTTNNLTALETLVVNNLTKCDTFDEKHYSSPGDISTGTGIEMKVLRGVISSLVQKEIIEVEQNFFRKGDTIILLNHVS